MVVTVNDNQTNGPGENASISDLDKGVPNHKAEHLTQGGVLAFITHLDKVYTLRITRAGKLILTK